MSILIFLLSFFVFIKTMSYAKYEIKQNNNKSGGIIITILASISLICPTLLWVIL